MAEAISFIGGGNMATSLIGGLVANGMPAGSICVADPERAQLEKLSASFGVRTTTDNGEALSGADTVVLAVKPQIMKVVCKTLGEGAARTRPLIVSIAAGIREPDLRRWLGYAAAIVRTMPNTPALVQCGATALYANELVSEAARASAEAVMQAVGLTVWVDDESELDAVTAVSGSGPAYCFLLIELMVRAGVDMGLSEEVATRLSLQTVLGAATMASRSDASPATLRERVTSPGGTTERALEIFAEGDLAALVARALQGARARAVELGEQLGAD